MISARKKLTSNMFKYNKNCVSFHRLLNECELHYFYIKKKLYIDVLVNLQFLANS